MTAPHSAYPRPQMKRDSFICLNGRWDFCITSGADMPCKFDSHIMVPFPPESKASGVERRIKKGDIMWYRRHFEMERPADGSRVLLHFGAVDQKAKVYVNGSAVAEHEGILPFSADITEHLAGDNEITVMAEDALDHAYPWGKQKHKNGGMWYTPFSGIWQTVWIEVVPKCHITGLKITPSMDSVRIEASTSEPCEIRWNMGDEAGTFSAHGTAAIRIENPVNWTPENPHLYDITITAGEDRVQSYFALRTLSMAPYKGVWRILLNGKPYFFHGLLDQGYWPNGICLPPDSSGYEKDVRMAKELGFNTLRKHIRIENELFYYACDKLGMVVFQDMVNNGGYSFIRDTALPTVGIQKLGDKNFNKNARSRRIFDETMEGTAELLYNHPCIAYWTIFNEGWGQFDADGRFDLLHSIDNTRIIDSTSGWFKQKKSDVQSEHVYFKPFKMKKAGRPVVLSEFGGYAYAAKGKKYGYRFFEDGEKYMAAVASLYEKEVVPAIAEGLCGAIYTQLSDVEEEQNGVITFDRSSFKADPEGMRNIAELIAKEEKKL